MILTALGEKNDNLYRWTGSCGAIDRDCQFSVERCQFIAIVIEPCKL